MNFDIVFNRSELVECKNKSKTARICENTKNHWAILAVFWLQIEFLFNRNCVFGTSTQNHGMNSEIALAIR